jgi:hypothetical protein
LVRAVCWAPRQEKFATLRTSGRRRIGIHGAIDLATGQTRMIEALYPTLAPIHVFRANARYFTPRITVTGRTQLASLRSQFHRAALDGTFGSLRPAGAADQRSMRLPRRRAAAILPLVGVRSGSPAKRPLSNFPAGPQNLGHFGAVQARIAADSALPLCRASPWRSRNRPSR